MDNFIYLDNNATTPLDPWVFEAMAPYFTHFYANAASNHAFGTEINQAVKDARATIAQFIGAENHEIVFTSGSTEAINLAIRGIMRMNEKKGKHLITVTTEHPAVLDTCKYLEKEGFDVTYLPVDHDGIIHPDELEMAIRPDTILVNVMLVNNETGVIQPLKEIASLVHEHGAYFMTDATQAFGKMPINVDELGIDLMSFSAHKFYGPKGVGGLFVRARRPFKAKLEPLLFGGGHENGLRSGTLNVPGIVGMGKAVELAATAMEEDGLRIGRLRDELEAELLKVEDSFLNGSKEHRLYNTANICFSGIDADALIVGLKDVMLSNGSACSSTKTEPSHVLVAMGRTEQDVYSSLRISLGRFTTNEDIEIAISRIKEEIDNIRKNLLTF